MMPHLDAQEWARSAERDWIEQGHEPLTGEEREILFRSYVQTGMAPPLPFWLTLEGRKTQ